MSSNANADGGEELGGFNPEVISADDMAAVAECTRSAREHTNEDLIEVMSETDSVFIRLDSTWWGNEAFGVWGDMFLIHPDNVSPSGKALFVSSGVKASDPMGKMRSARRMNSSGSGWTSKAASRTRRKAFNWGDTTSFGPGAPPEDDRDSFTDACVPLSVIRFAVRLPESEEHTVVDSNGSRSGAMSEGDIRVSSRVRDEYGWKFALTGDTYNLLSSGGENLREDMSWNVSHCTFNGDSWVMDDSSEALNDLIDAVTSNGYTVSIDSDVASLEESN